MPTRLVHHRWLDRPPAITHAVMIGLNRLTGE
jgi:hypothetical protein